MQELARAEDLDWDAVYADQAPRVYNYFRFRLGRDADVEELTARTFERACLQAVRLQVSHPHAKQLSQAPIPARALCTSTSISEAASLGALHRCRIAGNRRSSARRLRDHTPGCA